MKCNIKKAIIAILSIVILSSCSRKVVLTASQERTISPQAATYIKSMKSFSVLRFIKLKDKMIIKGREQLTALEKVQEQNIIDRLHLTIDTVTITNVRVLKINPPKISSGMEEVIALSMHGCAFTMGLASDWASLLLSGEMGITVYSIDYALAPEARYPIALNQCFEVYKSMIKGHSPNKMMVVSSSSGGSLALAMLLKAQEQNLPMPNRYYTHRRQTSVEMATVLFLMMAGILPALHL